MTKKMTWILLGFLLVGVAPLCAAETSKMSKTKDAFKKIGSLEKRGVINMVTSPSEFAAAFTTEKKEHPKIWSVTSLPIGFMNFLTRLGSGVNDVFIVPWSIPFTHDSTPLTRRFDLPDYIWEKE